MKENKICVTNFNGKGYGDSPKYITREIIKRNLNFEIVWNVNKEVPLPKIRTVRYDSLRSIYEAVTSKIWIDNTRKQPYVRKRKNQFYIQTWHGGIGVKKSEKDAEDQLSPYYRKQAKNDSTMIDLLLSNSNYCTEYYKRAFWYNGEILECGYPRNDILLNSHEAENIAENVYKYFDIKKSTNIILYAPTFRNNFDTDVYDLDFNLILNAIDEKTKTDWIFLVRMHPSFSEKSSSINYNETIINATPYDDMQELLLVSSILITDYSSAMFDFMLMNKPVFLYAKDYERYKESEREFYFDLLELPFPYAFSNTELLNKILKFDSKLYMDSLQLLHNRLGIYDDGHAAKRVVDRILEEVS